MRTEPIERRHEQNHAIEGGQRGNGIHAVQGKVHVAVRDLHVEQDLVKLLLYVLDASLVGIGNDQARGLLAKYCGGSRHRIVGGKHPQLMLARTVLYAGALHQQHGRHGNKDRPHHKQPHPAKMARTVADMLYHAHRASSPLRQNASSSRLAALKYTCCLSIASITR